MGMEYWKIAPGAVKSLYAANLYLEAAGLDPALRDLIFLRVSQINGCAYCIELHACELRGRGEPDHRLDALMVWRDTDYFTAAERAALAWAETVTRLTASELEHAAALEDLVLHFSEAAVVDLTLAAAVMNAWNRLSVPFRRPPRPHGAPGASAAP